MIDWNDNAHDAIEEYREWMIKNGKKIDIFLHQAFLSENVERRASPTQKTVADAVEYYKGVWPKHVNGCTHMKWDGEHGMYLFSCARDDYRHVCTREQFEAYVKEQEDEKWTHVDSDGNECRILHTIGDHSWVTYKNNSYEDELWPNVELRVIKPTISKAEAWDKVASEDLELSVSVSAIKQQYDII